MNSSEIMENLYFLIIHHKMKNY